MTPTKSALLSMSGSHRALVEAGLAEVGLRLDAPQPQRVLVDAPRGAVLVGAVSRSVATPSRRCVAAGPANLRLRQPAPDVASAVGATRLAGAAGIVRASTRGSPDGTPATPLTGSPRGWSPRSCTGHAAGSKTPTGTSIRSLTRESSIASSSFCVCATPT